MNEVTRIHLGRQAFTISVDAHHELKTYLKAIEKEVNNKEVLEEVELRMAELLIEKGIDTKKVILPKDVNYLKKQLGEASDFSENEPNNNTKPADDDSTPKHLFRDPGNGMIAGVAAGLGAYLGIDPIIVRVAFVLLTFTWGGGILAYIILWLLMPPVRTNSDRLQMNGKAVTVDNIKEVVSRADVADAANKVGATVSILLRTASRIVSGIVGVFLVILGACVAAAAVTVLCFGLIHGLTVDNTILFPVGVRETVALVAGVVLVTIIALLIMLTGQAMIRRRWSVPGWMMAACVGLFIASAAIGAATTATIVQPVRQRIDSVEHNTWRPMPKFTKVDIGSGISNVSWGTTYDSSYGVYMQSFGKNSGQSVTTKVVNGTLYIGGSPSDTGCSIICPYGDANVQLQIHTPNPNIPITQHYSDGSSNIISGANPGGPIQEIAPPDQPTVQVIGN